MVLTPRSLTQRRPNVTGFRKTGHEELPRAERPFTASSWGCHTHGFLSSGSAPEGNRCGRPAPDRRVGAPGSHAATSTPGSRISAAQACRVQRTFSEQTPRVQDPEAVRRSPDPEAQIFRNSGWKTAKRDRVGCALLGGFKPHALSKLFDRRRSRLALQGALQRGCETTSIVRGAEQVGGFEK